ncbi:hypothetical protein K9N68_10185 [Kovacikia minuta CCNUW1]|uniref:hypothetical protein n=1 Tax=Kovacikia minuta TaxID=2931930 RepID=UPI001CD034FF|nr:hypothetical protein [Kovacikia minuta]UBF28211.1 hypothetical protein K9N68_10185 [Kovacikia minuta CCNUW1]
MLALVGSRFTLITSIVAHLFAPSQPARLSPGIYATGASSHVQIVRMGQRFCLATVSRNETTFASVRPDRNRPGLYQVNGFPGMVISQRNSNTILWGSPSQMVKGSRDRQKEQANLPIPKDLQRCLSSNKPFFSRGKG